MTGRLWNRIWRLRERACRRTGILALTTVSFNHESSVNNAGPVCICPPLPTRRKPPDSLVSSAKRFARLLHPYPITVQSLYAL